MDTKEVKETTKEEATAVVEEKATAKDGAKLEAEASSFVVSFTSLVSINYLVKVILHLGLKK